MVFAVNEDSLTGG